MLFDILRTLAVELVAVLVFMAIAFAIGERIKRYDVADIAWGLVFIVIAVTGSIVGAGDGGRQLLVNTLVIIWGLRLAGHIFTRFRRKHEEDRRYTEMRSSFSAHPIALPYLRIFLTQGLLALIVTLPVTVVNSTSLAGFDHLIGLGAVVWLIGFFFETVGDAQLTRFLANPANKGTLLTSGLWRYTRHPNYFGEITQWWGIGLIALGVPFGWAGLIGPIAITYFILKVSGVPMLEKSYAGRADWIVYKSKTSMLIPWIPLRTTK